MADSEEMPLKGGQSSGITNSTVKQPNKYLRKWQILAVIFIVLTIAMLIALIAVIITLKSCDPLKIAETHTDACPQSHTSDEDRHQSEDIYKGLSSEETQQVLQFMFSSDLDIVPVAQANLSSNYVYSIEDYLPNKQDVMDWLGDKSAEPPMRRARVIVFMGKTREVKDYLVSPIPNPANFQEAFVNRKAGKSLSWKSRPIDQLVETPLIMDLITKESTRLLKVFGETFSNVVDQDCIAKFTCVFFNIIVRSKLDSDDRHIYIGFTLGYTQMEAYYLYPINIYMIVSTPGNEDSYKTQAIYYNGYKFDSADALLERYANDTSIRFILPALRTNEPTYGNPQYVPRKSAPPQTRRAPQQYYPDGQRFTVNRQHIEYLGWSFDFHTRTLSGMQLFNIKFEGEEIAYQVSMEDIVVVYAGAPPDDYFKSFFDNGWAGGTCNRPLMRGVDCPSGAVYIDSLVYKLAIDDTTLLKDAICVFEHSNSVPLRRHFSTDFYKWGYRYAFSMPDSVLIVRQILTVWNYDYIFDYEFHQNGVVELKVTSTGYVAMSPNIEGKEQYGILLNPEWKAGANLHHHVFNYKIDLDVAGQTNRFETINIKSETVKDSRWAGNQSWYQMVMEKELISNEQGAKIRYDFDTPKYYTITNEGAVLNGQKRGYRIYSPSFSKMVLPDESPLLRGGASWMKYQLAVTKYDDNERTTTSHFVQGSPDDPAINFDDFFTDDDNLVDEDLVAWVTVGLHHIPTFEDLPVTTSPGKTLTVALLPFNYFERDPSVHSTDAVLFWNKEYFDNQNEYMEMNGTCIPQLKPPSIHADHN